MQLQAPSLPASTAPAAPARRGLLKAGLALGAATVSHAATAQSWAPSPRYPDPSIEILDPSFAKYRLFSAGVERLATGLRWAEGPAWVGDGGYLLFSDVASNRIMRWDEATGQATPYRQSANYPNGNTRDMQGRLLTCEGAVTRRITRTEHSGRITVLADNYEGKRFNSPNDIVCQSNGTVWFTDPPFQLSNNYEGRIATSELPDAVYRIDPQGKITQAITDLRGPNGLCFSPDEKKLYVIEGRAQPHRLVWAYDVGRDGRLSNKTRHIDAGFPAGALDGIKCDEDGNIWAGWGSSGLPGVDPAPLDGVLVFNPQGKPIGHIHLPERCANLCFGGVDGNRLFMASSHSVYALYLNTRGAEVRG